MGRFGNNPIVSLLSGTAFFTIGYYILYYRVVIFVIIKPSTPWSSRAVPQLSTDLALHRLAMEFEWDPAFSMQYGRRLMIRVSFIISLKYIKPDSNFFHYRVLSLSGSFTIGYCPMLRQTIAKASGTTLPLITPRKMYLCRALKHNE